MEITLNIPQNTWSKPVEVRTEVVQAICNAFLKGGWWYPYLALLHKETGKFAETHPWKDERYQFHEFHETEMRAAFQALQKAGWHMVKHDMSNGTWYYLSKRDYSTTRGNYIVTDFYEQWD